MWYFHLAPLAWIILITMYIWGGKYHKNRTLKNISFFIENILEMLSFQTNMENMNIQSLHQP